MLLSSLTLNDAILFFAFLYSSSDIFVDWDSFESCAKPIQYWLLVSYASIITFRLSHYLGQCLSEDGEDFILYRQRGPPFWVNVLILGILFPFFCCWTIVGTVWFAQVQSKTPQCLPRGSHPWFFVFWLVLCYVWIVIYCLFIAIAAVFEYRARRAEQEFQILQNEDMLTRWGRINVFAQYGIHILRKGLTTEQIQKLPHEKLQSVPIDQSACSICLDDFRAGDDVRVLQACGHIFHRCCIDIWLLRNAICPNCKSAIYCSGGGREEEPFCRHESHGDRVFSTEADVWPSEEPFRWRPSHGPGDVRPCEDEEEAGILPQSRV
ncbi:zinc finger, C3HC4 type (RING finger) domain-containing protein [Toxoplasma gondii VAND]|uniref:Zinc finger, C3HC4 type (RING finger) domain-containing protein n=1 Tax=Toxoplasma gondii VAND TaxID=933077 RepID=A0A086QKG2_TOXGO|nr:zinc finger, C3HC4 type (RING finger) domain-containing protein [Toxoplasma gondii VAND]